MRILYLLTGIFGILIVFSIAVFLRPIDSNVRQRPEFNSDLIGKSLPTVNYYNLDEKTLDIRDLNNGNVILIAIQTGCKACKVQIQNLNKIKGAVSGNLKIYLVGFESTADLKEYSKILDIKETIIRADLSFFKETGINAFPTVFFVRNGVISNGLIGIVSDVQLNSWLEEK